MEDFVPPSPGPTMRAPGIKLPIINFQQTEAPTVSEGR